MKMMLLDSLFVIVFCRLSGPGKTYKASDAYLCSSVTELCERGVEKPILLPERLDISICMRLRSLESHICISDFWNRRAGRNNVSRGPGREHSTIELTSRKR